MLHFDWEEHNIAHIARHRVTQQEAEYVLNNDPIAVEAYLVGEEERIFSVGETSNGRILVIVTTEIGESVRVVTAFTARKALQDFLF